MFFNMQKAKAKNRANWVKIYFDKILYNWNMHIIFTNYYIVFFNYNSESFGAQITHKALDTLSNTQGS